MKKNANKLLALALTASMVLGGCGGAAKPAEGKEEGKKEDTKQETAKKEESKKEESSASSEGIKDLVISKLASRELETFNMLYSQRAEDFENLANLIDGLLEADPYGKLVPCIAEEWGTKDGGKNWTFKLRDGVKWVDVNGNEKGDCTAQDFATGLEWVLNFHKNDSSNTAMPIEMIKGAEEYYEYTKSLSPEEAKALKADEGSKFFEMVGMTVPDANTITYECLTKKPYFDSVATYACLYPLSQALVDELGIDGVKSMNNENMWYNGCYTMTTYIQGNEKIFTKNDSYWDKDAKLFDTVTVKMTESSDVDYQLFQSGEIDETGLSESNLKIISEDPNHEYYKYLSETLPRKYSYQFHFNYNRKNEDGTPDVNWNTAVSNEAFRKCWYYGLDLVNYWKRTNATSPMKCENLFYTMKGLVYTSDGKEYTELVRENLGLPEQNGETPVRLDKEKAEGYKKQAIEELTALGVTFPINVVQYIKSGNQVALDNANVLKQCFVDAFGTDFINLETKTYVSSARTEVYVPHLHSFVTNGWGADYGDPQNYLGQECYGNDNAYYSANYSYINEITEETPATKDLLAAYKEYTKMVEEADAITDDMDARYKAYAKAEAYMLEHALVVPCNYSVSWNLTKINPHSKMNAMFGVANDKMKNWETKADAPYTTEEMDKIFAEKEAKAK